jgi:PAS domain S-box-containing protein
VPSADEEGGSVVNQELYGTEARRSPGSPLLLSAAIVNSSDDAIVAKTMDGTITSWNPGAERLYGYSADEILGRPITLLCPPDRVGEIKELLARIGHGERVVHHRTERVRKDGTRFPVSVTLSPVYDEGGALIGASSIARDITDQQKAEAELLLRTAELERVNENLESFTYSVAHDLRAPLRALGGFSAALLEDYADSLDETGRGYAGHIRDASDQMAQLIDDLLDLSRVAQADVHLQPVDLGAEAVRIVAELKRGEPERRVTFTAQQPAWARADRQLIRTVLQNLLENAWKFTDHRAEASIEFGTMPAEDGRVCLYLRDDGAGFDPAYAGKLFNPFQRLHSARDFPGTGVGLASVRRIVERHGGRVWAESVVGAGATFYFTLDAVGPRALPAHPAGRGQRGRRGADAAGVQ